MKSSDLSLELIEFWDQAFKNLKPERIITEDSKIKNVLDELLKFLGDNCETILDIGCGGGTMLMFACLHGEKVKRAVGFDTSKHAIDFANETCKLSNINKIEFICSTHTYLEKLTDNSFDGIYISNFLDVIPPKLCEEIIIHIKRIVKPNGYFLLKLNFELNAELIHKLNMVALDKDVYTINGILRAVNRSTEKWISFFDGFEVIRVDEYPRIPGYMDRVILFKKI